MQLTYKLIRSNRKTLALEVKGAQVLVRAPYECPQKKIDEFVASHERWLEKKLAEGIEKSRSSGEAARLSEKDLNALYKRAREYFPQRVEWFAKVLGVTYGTITIRCQKTKWGSCSSKGNLNFNCLLMLTPPEVIDSVVVHELCHRKEMNHSKRFYAEVYRACPEYNKYHKWLKEHGNALMALVR